MKGPPAVTEALSTSNALMLSISTCLIQGTADKNYVAGWPVLSRLTEFLFLYKRLDMAPTVVRHVCCTHPQMMPVLAAQFFSGYFESSTRERGFMLKDDLTAGIWPALFQKLDMESLPRIVFGPNAVAATVGVLRKSDQSGERREGS